MGTSGISRTQLLKILGHKKLENFELIKGKIPQSIKNFIQKNPELRVALLSLDIDIYDKDLKALEILYPLLEKNGILIVNDYKIFERETKIIDDYFKAKDVKIQRLPF